MYNVVGHWFGTLGVKYHSFTKKNVDSATVGTFYNMGIILLSTKQLKSIKEKLFMLNFILAVKNIDCTYTSSL